MFLGGSLISRLACVGMKAKMHKESGNGFAGLVCCACGGMLAR